MLLVIDKACFKIKMGIIDYFRQYDFTKKVEFEMKKLIFKEDPTIINP
jgi:hypothetical protein